MAAPSWVLAEPGSLDISFGNRGKVVIPTFFPDNPERIYDTARTVAVQQDGKIVVVGSVTQGTTGRVGLVRLNPDDGSFDLTFGNGGKASFRSSLFTDSIAESAAIQPDGKIVVVGAQSDRLTIAQDLLVARFDTLGELDASFGGNGWQIVAQTQQIAGSPPQRSADSWGYAIAVQTDGRIVVAGRYRNTSTD